MLPDNASTAERILYVDDDPEITDIASMALQELGGYQVEICRSGDEACLRARESRPELIILDINMPGLDGRQTLAKLRQNEATSRIPVIFISGDARAREIARGRESGILGLIEKPFDPLDLPHLVADLWQRGDVAGKQPSLEAELEALRLRFRTRLPGRLEELRQVWHAASATNFEPGALERVHRLTHNLAGAAGAHEMRALSARMSDATRKLRSWQLSRRVPSADERAGLENLICSDHLLDSAV